MENKLTAGDYIILIEPYWSTTIVKKFSLSTYSDHDVELELLPLTLNNYKKAEYLIWKNFAKRNLEIMTAKGSRTASSGNKAAVVDTYLYQNKNYASVLYTYINKGTENAVHTSYAFNSLKGFNALGQNVNDQGAEVIINPQDLDVIYFKMDPKIKGFSVTLTVISEEVISHRFTEDLSVLELIHALGGAQPTSENPNPELISRQKKQADMQMEREYRQKVRENLLKQNEEVKRQNDLERRKLEEERKKGRKQKKQIDRTTIRDKLTIP